MQQSMNITLESPMEIEAIIDDTQPIQNKTEKLIVRNVEVNGLVLRKIFSPMVTNITHLNKSVYGNRGKKEGKEGEVTTTMMTTTIPTTLTDMTQMMIPKQTQETGHKTSKERKNHDQ